MRGTGYAIIEILIFLAIASIVGFLLGWLVFRRGETSAPSAAKLDTKELRRAETRVKALEALMSKAESRAQAAVAAASKAATIAPAATGAAAVAAASPAKAEKTEKVRPKKAPEPARPAAPEKKAPEPAKADTKKVADKPPAEKKPEAAEPKTSTGDEELDEYLSDADQRIQKLEKTLERLRGKLDDLEE